MKKLLIIALTVVMMFSVLAGCTNTGQQTPSPTQAVDKSPTEQPTGEPTTEPEDNYGDTGGLTLPLVDKEVKLTWMLVTSLTDVNDKPIIKELEKRTGINLDIQAVPGSSYAEKLKITMGSGN